MRKVLNLSLIEFTSLLITCSAAVADNLDNAIAVPRKSYPLLFTLHAKKALIQRHGKKYDVILKDVYPIMSYNMQTDNNGFQPVEKFFTQWESNNQSKLVEADITGVQVNNKTIGHAQFYATVFLQSPHYDIKNHYLKFSLSPIKNSIKITDTIYFENVVLFDNGCYLMKC